ncbi:hypothetical protein MspRI1_17320 [Marinobacter sp. RI1]
MHKDCLLVMITALADECGDFCFSIAGVTAQQYVDMVPEHQFQVDSLREKLLFLGRIPNSESLDLLRSADF